jgi:hypothetical protein
VRGSAPAAGGMGVGSAVGEAPEVEKRLSLLTHRGTHLLLLPRDRACEAEIAAILCRLDTRFGTDYIIETECSVVFDLLQKQDENTSFWCYYTRETERLGQLPLRNEDPRRGATWWQMNLPT